MTGELNLTLSTIIVVVFYILVGYLILRSVRWFVTFVADRV